MRVEEAWKRARADEDGPMAVAGDALLGELYAARGLLKGRGLLLRVTLKCCGKSCATRCGSWRSAARACPREPAPHL